MSETNIQVNRKNTEEFLGGAKTAPFVIPEYQRPYAWGDEQIQTLFDDLWEFSKNKTISYFLGCIVSFVNASGEQEIIDGQQRITSFYLLLRAIYTKLENVETKQAPDLHFLGRIAPLIWAKDRITGIVDRTHCLLTSRVISSDGNDTFSKILETGAVNPKAKDNYSKNYRKFQELFDQKINEAPLAIFDFIADVLDKAIFLPITTNSQDSALTIFSTLNNRGLPLSDSDIFKAKMYDHIQEAEKQVFITKWQELDERANDANESVQNLFYYYMFYLRALEGDTRSTTPGVRKYYSPNEFKKLQAPNLLDDLAIQTNLWEVISKHATLEGESWSNDSEILKALDILRDYPNEFWKYPVVTYYLAHRNKEDFQVNFLRFLRKLVVETLSNYVINPTINAVKSEIVKLDAAIIRSSSPSFSFRALENTQFKSRLLAPHKATIRMLLKILAYQRQDALLPSNWEIEHIFPHKYQGYYFPKNSEEEVKEKLEFLGNKIPFEKKLNIKAGNGFFSSKKKHYSKSVIVITREFAELQQDDWGLEDIEARGNKVSEQILELLQNWNREYLNAAQ